MKSVRVANPRCHEPEGKRVMRDPKTFVKYAEECRRMADKMPQHKTTLLEMAEAWLACAKSADAEMNGSHVEPQQGANKCQ